MLIYFCLQRKEEDNEDEEEENYIMNESENPHTNQKYTSQQITQKIKTKINDIHILTHLSCFIIRFFINISFARVKNYN